LGTLNEGLLKSRLSPAEARVPSQLVTGRFSLYGIDG